MSKTEDGQAPLNVLLLVLYIRNKRHVAPLIKLRMSQTSGIGILDSCHIIVVIPCAISFRMFSSLSLLIA